MVKKTEGAQKLCHPLNYKNLEHHRWNKMDINKKESLMLSSLYLTRGQSLEAFFSGLLQDSTAEA